MNRLYGTGCNNLNINDLLFGIYKKTSFQKNRGEGGSTLSGQVPDINGKSILMVSLSEE